MSLDSSRIIDEAFIYLPFSRDVFGKSDVTKLSTQTEIPGCIISQALSFAAFGENTCDLPVKWLPECWGEQLAELHRRLIVRISSFTQRHVVIGVGLSRSVLLRPRLVSKIVLWLSTVASLAASVVGRGPLWRVSVIPVALPASAPASIESIQQIVRGFAAAHATIAPGIDCVAALVHAPSGFNDTTSSSKCAPASEASHCFASLEQEIVVRSFGRAGERTEQESTLGSALTAASCAIASASTTGAPGDLHCLWKGTCFWLLPAAPLPTLDSSAPEAGSSIRISEAFQCTVVSTASDTSHSDASAAAAAACIAEDLAVHPPSLGAVVGGSFDRLHAGHHALLTVTSLLSRARAVIGVTGTAMLARKGRAEEVLPWRARARAVREWLGVVHASAGLSEAEGGFTFSTGENADENDYDGFSDSEQEADPSDNSQQQRCRACKGEGGRRHGAEAPDQYATAAAVAVNAATAAVSPAQSLPASNALTVATYQLTDGYGPSRDCRSSLFHYLALSEETRAGGAAVNKERARTWDGVAGEEDRAAPLAPVVIALAPATTAVMAVGSPKEGAGEEVCCPLSPPDSLPLPQPLPQPQPSMPSSTLLKAATTVARAAQACQQLWDKASSVTTTAGSGTASSSASASGSTSAKSAGSGQAGAKQSSSLARALRSIQRHAPGDCEHQRNCEGTLSWALCELVAFDLECLLSGSLSSASASASSLFSAHPPQAGAGSPQWAALRWSCPGWAAARAWGSGSESFHAASALATALIATLTGETPSPAQSSNPTAQEAEGATPCSELRVAAMLLEALMSVANRPWRPEHEDSIVTLSQALPTVARAVHHLAQHLTARPSSASAGTVQSCTDQGPSVFINAVELALGGELASKTADIKSTAAVWLAAVWARAGGWTNGAGILPNAAVAEQGELQHALGWPGLVPHMHASTKKWIQEKIKSHCIT